MSKMMILNQPVSEQLGNYLVETLHEKDYTNFTFAVAFAKNSGVLRLKESLEFFRSKGSSINAFVGVDLGGTSYEALTSLFGLVDNLYVVHVESDQTFHPKVYSFTNSSEGLLVIGSSNMTGGGLWTNFESSAIVNLSFENPADLEIKTQTEGFFSFLRNSDNALSIRISSQDDIDKLLESKYIEKEVATRIQKAKYKKDSSEKQISSTERRFASNFRAPIPKLNQEQKVSTVLVTANPADEKGIDGPSAEFSPLTEDDYQIVWFETRAMTGGSGNQLDISMKAAIESGNPSGTEFAMGEPNLMKGGVQFFGIDPEHTEEKKDITINYNGVDYYGNTLLFYTSGKRPNGSWRLQIKGQASDGSSFTSNVAKDGFLKHKVLVFSRVESDYYFMTVFPEEDLDEFKNASTLVARNGAGVHARYFGLL